MERFEVLQLEPGEARVYDHARAEVIDGGPDLVACCDLADELNAKTTKARAKWPAAPRHYHPAIVAKRAAAWARAHPEIQLTTPPWHWSNGDGMGDRDALPPKTTRGMTTQEHIARYA